LPGVAIAVRAMEKFAVLGVDSLGIAHSERAAATNRDTSNVGPGLLACWHLGSQHVASLEALNGLSAHAGGTICAISLVRQESPLPLALIARVGCCQPTRAPTHQHRQRPTRASAEF
jgi:hypothetical protein